MSHFYYWLIAHILKYGVIYSLGFKQIFTLVPDFILGIFDLFVCCLFICFETESLYVVLVRLELMLPVSVFRLLGLSCVPLHLVYCLNFFNCVPCCCFFMCQSRFLLMSLLLCCLPGRSPLYVYMIPAFISFKDL